MNLSQPSIRKQSFPFFLAVLIICILGNCSSDNGPETIVKRFVADFEQVVEERDYRKMRTLISEHYSDEQNRSRQDITSIAAGYMLRNKSIHVFTRLESLQDNESNLTASILAAVAGRPIDDLATLPSLNAEMYLVEIVLDTSGKSPRLLSASWRQAMLEDFLSE